MNKYETRGFNKAIITLSGYTVNDFKFVKGVCEGHKDINNVDDKI